MTRVAINGFGRIGRRFFRLAIDREDPFEIVAIHDLTDVETLAHMLKYDSAHGTFSAEVVADGSDLIVNGNRIKILAHKDPAQLPWKDLGVDIAVESTGIFTDREPALKHSAAGAKRAARAPGPMRS